MISTDARISPDYFLSQELLDRINVEYAVISNTENLNQLGGASGLCSKLGVNPKFGLDDAHVRQMEAYYGNNAMPVAQMKSIFQIFVSTFSDNAIIVLVTAAIVSIIVEELHDPTEGWIQGTAILVAVIIVAVVTTINEYAKERQFRALEISAQREERASVWRNGCINRINPDGIVVGDILVLQVC